MRTYGKASRQAVNSAQLNGTEMQTTWFDQVLPQVDLNIFQTQFTGNRTLTANDFFGILSRHTKTDYSDLVIQYFRNVYK